MTTTFEKLPLSRLKGISVCYEDDLHDLALLMLRLNDARAAYEGNTSISRPTVNGLAKTFAQLVNACYPDYEPVFAAVKKHDLPLGVAIEFDDRIRR